MIGKMKTDEGRLLLLLIIKKKILIDFVKLNIFLFLKPEIGSLRPVFQYYY